MKGRSRSLPLSRSLGTHAGACGGMSEFSLALGETGSRSLGPECPAGDDAELLAGGRDAASRRPAGRAASSGRLRARHKCGVASEPLRTGD
jgi:hypothetical protein